MQVATRNYKPDFYHILRGHSGLAIDVQSYQDWMQEPAILSENIKNNSIPTQDGVKSCISAMEEHKDNYDRIIKGGDHDLFDFWLRKSQRPVLSVLVVRRTKSDGTKGALEFYRGSNMEVSMPTGSLCAERNAIGSALANDMSLKRSDLLMVAVYSPSKVLDPKKDVGRIRQT